MNSDTQHTVVALVLFAAFVCYAFVLRHAINQKVRRESHKTAELMRDRAVQLARLAAETVPESQQGTYKTLMMRLQEMSLD